MTIAIVAGLLFLAIVPHVATLENASPAPAIAVWLGVLVVRALVVALGIFWLISFVPATQVFTEITHWCWHAVIPWSATHLGIDGHALGDLATLLPVAFALFSLASVVYGIVRAVRAVQRFVRRTRVGAGPRESILVREDSVLLAVVGIARPRVIVSNGALRRLDSEELAAGIEHERGHIGRQHQRILLLAELCRGLARLLPGTDRAMRELIFHAERDADQWALRRDHDPSVLASAICKAALSPATAVAPALTGGQTTRRVRLLLDERGNGRSRDGVACAIATTLTVVALMFVAAVPDTVASASVGARAAGAAYTC
ncbi:MAG: M56 family metallopeptidase [Solirubrobacterales bacterium]